MKSYSPNEYSPKINEGAASMFNALDTVKTNRSLMIITKALGMIYHNDANAHVWQKRLGVSDLTIQRIQGWYINQKINYSYGVLDSRETQRGNNEYLQSGGYISPQQQALINEFREDKHYGLKNFVEILARSIIENKLRAQNNFENIEIYLASDIDDILGGVDIIVNTIDKSGKIHTIGIDVAVSRSAQYLEEKEKIKTARLEEFYKQNKTPRKYAPRIVYNFPPELMQKSIIDIMEGFETFQQITPERISNTHNTKNTYPLQSQISELVQNIILH